MKVLQCISSLEGGGAEKQFGYLCESLVELGVEVVAVSLRPGKNLNRVLKSGATYIQIKNSGNFDPLIIWRMYRLVALQKPDVIQSWIPQMDIFAGIVARLARVPHVVSERTSKSGLPSGWRETLRIAIGRRASAVVANGMGGKEYWHCCAPKVSTTLIPNAIPFSDIEAALPDAGLEIGLRPNDELVVYLGQLIQIKNISNLVPAIIEVVKQRAHTKAVLVGEGVLAAEVTSAATASGYGSHIRVIPFTESPYGWLKRASVFVSVSEYEGNPNTVLEAIAAGCPVVVSDIPAHREFLDDRSAIFVSGQSHESIATGLLEVLNNPFAAKERAELARKRLAGRTSVSTAMQYFGVYQNILRKRNMDGTSLGLEPKKTSHRFELFRCPICKGELGQIESDFSILSDGRQSRLYKMRCSHCRKIFQIRNSIPRFVTNSDYSASFGFQWNIHGMTQLDSYTRLPISRNRLFESTEWPQDMKGETILEAGSGAGRFTEVLLDTGATVFSFDYSDAVDANLKNNGKYQNLTLFQASIYDIPFSRGIFDKVICLGVIQHTPDPAESFRKLTEMVRPGGELVIDCYARDLVAVLQWKYVLRPITKRVNSEVLYRCVSILVPILIPLARLLRKIAGRAGARIVPIVEYSHLGLQPTVNREWAILDTFDMYSPAHDHPQSISTVQKWFEMTGFDNIAVRRGQNGVVGRGRKR